MQLERIPTKMQRRKNFNVRKRCLIKITRNAFICLFVFYNLVEQFSAMGKSGEWNSFLLIRHD